MPTSLARLLILPALAALLVLAVPAAPASAIAPVPAAECPCWEAGGPFYTPASWCYDLGSTRFGFQTGMFAQTVTYGAVSYCRKNGSFSWTSPEEHAACNDSLHLACSPLLAVAYIDRNDNDVFDRPDGLIAKHVDANGSGSADAGDVMVTDEYPAAVGSTATGGTFGVKATECLVAFAPSTGIACIVPSVVHVEWARTPFSESFVTEEEGDRVTIADSFKCPGGTDDRIVIQAMSALAPTVPTLVLGTCSVDDENHIDVDLF